MHAYYSASAFRFSTRITPRVSAPTGTGARERGPARASSSGGKWDRERTEKTSRFPSVMEYHYLGTYERRRELGGEGKHSKTDIKAHVHSGS